MRSWKSYSIAAVFFVLCSTSLMACDVRGMIEDAVLSIVTGNNQGCAGCLVGCAADCGACGDCGSCGSCGSCGACGDCAGCEGCACTVGDIRDRSTGRKEGFNGRGAGSPSAQLLRDRGLHNGRRIANSVQARLSQSGLMFIQNLVPVVAAGVAGRIDLPADLNGGTTPGYLTASLENVQFRSEAGCQGNSQNGLATTAGTAVACLRLDANVRYRTCQPDPAGAAVCTNAESVQVQIDAPIVGTVTCQLRLNSAAAGGATATLPFTARIALMSDTTSTTYTGYSRIKVLDAQTSAAPIDRQDVDVTCSNAGTINGLLGANPGCWLTGNQPCNIDEAVDDAVSDLNDNMNTMIDALLDHYMPPFCAPAPAAIDCPTGTVYQAPAAGSPAGTAGTCLLAPSGAGCPTGTVYHAGDNRCYNVRDGGSVNTAADRWGTACLELLPGAEMRVDTGAVLGAISPGIESILDVMVSLGGNGEHANNGHNLNVMGGMEAVIAGLRSLPHNPCAPIEHPANDQAACDAISSGLEYEPMQNGAFSGRCIPKLPVIPAVSALRQNTAPIVNGLDGDFEVGVGVSESFVNYAAWRVWDSGLTCINAGSWLDPTLSPSLIAFALIAKPSQPRIFFPLNTDSGSGGSTNNANKRSVALGLRPQTAPSITFDQVDDPCEPGADTRLEISAALDTLHLDLSMWGDDRYLRVGTVDTDVNAVIALDIGPQTATASCPELAAGEISIAIARLDFGDAHWLPDAPLLTGSDFRTGSSGMLPIQSGFNTIGGIAGGIAADLIPSINAETMANGIIADLGTTLGAALPMHLEFHKDSFQLLEQTGGCSGAPYDSGVRGTDTCTYSFLGVFVDLANGAPTPLSGVVDTQVQITNVTIPEGREGFDMQGEFGTGQSPTVEIAMSATGPENVQFEYAYKTSYSGWSEWQRSPYAVISGNPLFVQGEQEVFARARIAGDEASEDFTSARATFTIDVTAPMIEVYAQDNGDAQLQALDLISDDLTYRVQEPGEDFGDWTALPASGIANLDIEDGSVIEVRDESGNVASTSDALQGRPNSANSAACGCTTAGASSNSSPLAMVGLAAMLALVVARRRRSVG